MLNFSFDESCRRSSTSGSFGLLDFVYLLKDSFSFLNRLWPREESKKPEANPRTGVIRLKSAESAERRKGVSELTDVFAICSSDHLNIGW